jgi:geranylgeranyl diphosphate synthase, type I
LGKTEDGDLRRKKMTLPVIHALAHASPADRAALDAIYTEPGQAREEQVAQALAILDRSGARNRAYSALQDQLETATVALDGARRLAGARNLDDGDAGVALASLITFIRADAEG